MKLTLPFPPSWNACYQVMRYGNRASLGLTKSGRRYKQSVAEALQIARRGQSVDGHLRVTIAVYVPDRRKRDLDNLLKPVLDSITSGGVWADDSQIRELHVRTVGLQPPGRLEIEITQLERLLF